MKKLIILSIFLSQMAFANNCKVTTIVTENNGRVDSETATICKEGVTVEPRVKIGDVILENEVGKSKIEKYFTYKGSQCRMFTEHAVKDKKLKMYNGVICQLDHSDTNWIVVDKW